MTENTEYQQQYSLIIDILAEMVSNYITSKSINKENTDVKDGVGE